MYIANGLSKGPNHEMCLTGISWRELELGAGAKKPQPRRHVLLEGCASSTEQNLLSVIRRGPHTVLWHHSMEAP